MPIPILLGIGAITAAIGAGKSVKAGIDKKDANRTNDEANRIVERATERINIRRKNSCTEITCLGEKKIWVLDNSVKPFISAFEKIKNIDFTESKGLSELESMRIDKQGFESLKKLQSMASSMVGGVVGGAVLGAATAFGAYGAVTTFAAASTGTAIASLSGAAATNATLAFLGGGSLAAGGLGIAGGTAVLGGLVAGPALAVLGFVVGAKASALKDEAHSNLAKAKEYAEEMKTAEKLCKGIRLRAAMFERLLIRLDCIFYPMVLKLEKIVEERGDDFSKYTEDEKHLVAASMSLAKAIKAVLDTPILTEDGTLTEESEEQAKKTDEYLESLV